MNIGDYVSLKFISKIKNAKGNDKEEIRVYKLASVILSRYV